MRQFFLIALTACVLGSSVSFAATLAKKEVKKGNVLYNKGKFEEALKEYEEAVLKSPDSDVVNFDLAAALYKTGDYEAALRHFEKSLVSEDEALEAAANYNLGNTEYKYGIAKENDALQEAISFLKRALGHFENAMLLDPEDEDAKYNHEFVKKELKRLQKKSEEEEKKEEERKEDKPESEEGKEEEPKEKEGEEKEEKKEEKEEETSQAEDKKDEEEGKEEESGKEEKEKPEEPEEKPGEEENGEGETQGGATGEERPAGEMSEEEAERLLANYRQEEEPKGLYREKLPASRFPGVLKDW